MKIHSFNSENEQITAITYKIRDRIEKLLQIKSHVIIAVSGGKSPIALFKHLANTNLPWQEINITLVDERIIPATDPESNEYLIRKHLLKNHAQEAKFIGIIPAIKKLATELAIDIAILGMGEDGHTASIFPDCKELADALNLNNPYGYIITHPITAKYDRVSMTLSSITQVPELLLCISGNTKLKVLQQAIMDESYPIHYVIKARNDLQVYTY